MQTSLEYQKDVKQKQLYYSYRILGAAFTIVMLTGIVSLNSFSLFVKPIENSFGWGRTAIMAGCSIMVFFIALSSPLTGRFLDQYGARKTMIPGTLFMITGLVILSQTQNLILFYLGYGLIGIAYTTNGSIGCSFLVSHWFRKKRGTAIGIMSAGVTLGGVIFIPLVAVYVIPHFGWRLTYILFALFVGAIILPLLVFVVHTKPEELGFSLIDEDIENTVLSRKNRSADKISVQAALTTKAFWFVAISLFLNHTHLGILQSVFPYFSDLGFSIDLVSAVSALTYAMISLGMIFFGWLCDRVAPKYGAALGLTLIAIGISLILVIDSSSSRLLLFSYGFILGLGIGSWLPTMSMLTSSIFGLTAYGQIFGMLSFFQFAGSASGNLIVGYSFDSFHSYQVGFISILLFVIAAIPLVLIVPKHKIQIVP